jgi:hypothetical protein
MGSDVAEAQIDELSDAEIDVLLEIYERLRCSAWTASPSEIACSTSQIQLQGLT